MENFYIYIIIIIIILIIKQKEHYLIPSTLYAKPHCDHIKPFRKPYKNSFYENNVSSGFECYKNCLDNNNCDYVGSGFDCYNYCFDNIGIMNTLGDYNQ